MTYEELFDKIIDHLTQDLNLEIIKEGKIAVIKGTNIECIISDDTVILDKVGKSALDYFQEIMKA